MNMHPILGRRGLRLGVTLLGLSLLAACAGPKDQQAAFKTPDEAIAAFVKALETDDVAELRRLLGPETDELLSTGDSIADQQDRADFLAGFQSGSSLVADGPDRMTLVTGPDEWPMPIPLVQRDGKWYLDGAAGADELIYRRVGANELGAIDVCRGYVNAQLEYASEGHDGDPAGIFALKLVSDEGLHNGLYWPTAEGEPPSPAGPFVAAAAAEGYTAGPDAQTPYHGYHYRMLYAQGENAGSGARDYFEDGVLTRGFALVAWPADYGSSGVQTFIVNQDGIVFQKDLGEDTATAVESIKSFDPDPSWIAIVPPEGPVA